MKTLHTRPTCESLIEIGETVLDMARSYTIKHKGEFFFDALLFGILRERYKRVARQLKLDIRAGQKRPQRIDFRVGGTNPTVIELAHGSRRGGLGPSSNKSELQKLCRHRKAQTRYLLLLDPSNLEPFERPELKSSYDKWNPGPGRFVRLPVSVVYIRGGGKSFWFGWGRRSKR